MSEILAGRHEIITHEIATGSGVLAVTTNYDRAFALKEVRLHVGVAPVAVENLTITIDAHAGAGYDILVKSIPMAGVTDYVWVPEQTCLCVSGDKIIFAWTNTNARTWGLTYIYRRVN